MAIIPTPPEHSGFWNRKKRSWLIGLAGVLLLMTALVFLLRPKKTDEAEIVTAPVTRNTITQTVAATGRVVPNFEVEIKAKASGEIIRLPYDVSDTVKQGDLLVQLNPIDESRQVSQAQASLSGLENRVAQSRLNLQVGRQNLQTSIDRARAELKAAEARYQEAQTKKARLDTLVQSRYISQEEYEAGVSSASQLGAELDSARVRLRELETEALALRAQARDVNIAAAESQAQRVAVATSQQRLSETRIYAPISGVVTSRAGQIGQIVASGVSNVGGGTAIMTLADLSHIFVLAAVDESDIGQVREGQFVSITADAYPGKTFAGKVVQIAPKGFEEANVVTFEVKIEVLGENKHLLKSEMTTNVEILIDRKRNVLTVPTEAVMLQDGRPAVRVVDGKNKTHGRPVVVGLNNGTQVEIVRGLRVGEKVAIGQADAQSRWKKDGSGGNGGFGNNRRSQQMMMRGLGGGGRR